MAWKLLSNRPVADQVSRLLSEPVIDRFVSGAHIICNLSISETMGLHREGTGERITLRPPWAVYGRLAKAGEPFA